LLRAVGIDGCVLASGLADVVQPALAAVTPALLEEAVAFFTATEATIIPVTDANGWTAGHVVVAKGYRAGPRPVTPTVVVHHAAETALS